MGCIRMRPLLIRLESMPELFWIVSILLDVSHCVLEGAYDGIRILLCRVEHVRHKLHDPLRAMHVPFEGIKKIGKQRA